MKKLIALLIVISLNILLVGCFKDSRVKTTKKTTYEIAFVTDIGQLKDKSFNQGTWEGVEAYAKLKNKSYNYYQPANEEKATDDDRYNALIEAVNNGAKIVVTAGYTQEKALRKAAIENPKIYFVFIDGYSLSDDNGNVLKNVAGISFREEQSGYLAGYAAVMEGYTKLGFVGGGGGTNLACQRFGYGYIQGANDAAKIKNLTEPVEMKYSWLYGSGFKPSDELEEMVDNWYKDGTEVIFACGGSMCQSVFKAAENNNCKTIGVDVDQCGESNTVITSATKGLKSATELALSKYYDNKWNDIGGKSTSLGAKDNAVCLPTVTWSMKNFKISQYENLMLSIKDQMTIVYNDPTDAEVKKYSNVTIILFE